MENKAELINSYEFVIRFNGFVIDGFKKDVGAKIDAISFWTPTPSKVVDWPPGRSISENYEKYKGKVLMFTSYKGKPDDHVISRAKNTFLFDTSTTMYPEKNPVCECVKSKKFRNTCTFSSGLCLAMNLSIFFGKKVHLIGFDGWKTGYLYDNSVDEDMIVKDTCHNPFLERYIISRLKDVVCI